MSEIAAHSGSLTPEMLTGDYSLVSYIDLAQDQQLAYESAMRGLLQPFYGPQDSALEKIRVGLDREADVVIDGAGAPVATLVYKTDLVSETHWDMRHGDTVRTSDSLEVKTLALFNPGEDGSRGIGSALLNRADTIAAHLGAKGISLTVTDESGAKDFFTRHGYWWGIYKTATHPSLPGHVVFKLLQPDGIDNSGRWFS